jgi:hypothetical protein
MTQRDTATAGPYPVNSPLFGRNLIGLIEGRPNGISVWLYLFSWNRTEIVLVLPQNESHRQRAAYCLSDSVVFAPKKRIMKNVVIIQRRRERRAIGVNQLFNKSEITVCGLICRRWKNLQTTRPCSTVDYLIISRLLFRPTNKLHHANVNATARHRSTPTWYDLWEPTRSVHPRQP